MKKFICPLCKGSVYRDMRFKVNKKALTKKGNFRSYCDENHKTTYCKPTEGE